MVFDNLCASLFLQYNKKLNWIWNEIDLTNVYMNPIRWI
jgi:hypothetical protein